MFPSEHTLDRGPSGKRISRPSLGLPTASQMPQFLKTMRGYWAAATAPQLWAFACLAGVFIRLCRAVVMPHDFWWHVRVGKWILENGYVPDRDLFSFTRAEQPFGYVLYWLADVTLYLLLRAGGLPLVIFSCALVITTAYGLLLWLNVRTSDGDVRWAATATLLAAGVGMSSWSTRPQVLSFLLFALTLFLIEKHAAESAEAPGYRSGSRPIWLLPPVFALWANVHGGFVIGLALLASFVLTSLWEWRRGRTGRPTALAASAALSLVATLVTPAGPRTLGFALSVISHPAVREWTMEWMPPTLQTPTGLVFFAFVTIWLLSLAAGRYRPNAHEYVRYLLFGGLALLAVRNVSWFGFVAAPSLAAALSRWSANRTSRSTAKGADRLAVNRVLALALAAAAVLSLPWFRPLSPLPQWRPYVSPDTPVRATSYLRTLPGPRRVFHSDAYGSYMIWASPEIPVFTDTRIDLYPPEQWSDYLAVSYARYDWKEILARYRIDTLFLDREVQQSLIAAASADPDWEPRYEDGRSVIMLLRRERDP